MNVTTRQFRNIFESYRPPAEGSARETLSDAREKRAIENNYTRALVICLERLHRAGSLDAWLDRLAVRPITGSAARTNWTATLSAMTGAEVQVHMQRTLKTVVPEPALVPHRVVLGVAGESCAWEIGTRSSDKGTNTIADALVTTSQSVIAIECKTVDSGLDVGQLWRYANQLEVDAGPILDSGNVDQTVSVLGAHVLECTWQDIRDATAAIAQEHRRDGVADPVLVFLLEEFCEFLVRQGVGTFTQVLGRNDNGDLDWILRSKAERFLRKVSAGLEKSGFLIDPGTIHRGAGGNNWIVDVHRRAANHDAPTGTCIGISTALLDIDEPVFCSLFRRAKAVDLVNPGSNTTGQQPIVTQDFYYSRTSLKNERMRAWTDAVAAWAKAHSSSIALTVCAVRIHGGAKWGGRVRVVESRPGQPVLHGIEWHGYEIAPAEFWQWPTFRPGMTASDAAKEICAPAIDLVLSVPIAIESGQAATAPYGPVVVEQLVASLEELEQLGQTLPADVFAAPRKVEQVGAASKVAA